MPGNTLPIFTRQGLMSGIAVTAANTRSDGVGTIATDIFLAFTADATNGSFVESISIWPQASVAATATTATVARVFASSVTSGATTATNTHPLGELALPSQSADSSTLAVYPLSLTLNLVLPPGWTILVTTHAAPAANTSQKAVVKGGVY